MDLEKLSEHNSAFPHYITNGDKYHASLGLTKREYFAGLAMQGLCSHPNTWDTEYDKLAESAVLTHLEGKEK